jgi:dTDP-glucose 4,6-dehydratase
MRRLLGDGQLADNFVTGRAENIAHLMGHGGFTFYRHDVSNYIFVRGKIDAVLHFASPASPNPQSPSAYFNLPIQTMKAGALGTHNTLGVAKAHGAKFLLASTSEIYGDPLVHPQVETYPGNVDPIGPRSVYDEAKRFAESLTMAITGRRCHNAYRANFSVRRSNGFERRPGAAHHAQAGTLGPLCTGMANRHVILLRG